MQPGPFHQQQQQQEYQEQQSSIQDDLVLTSAFYQQQQLSLPVQFTGPLSQQKQQLKELLN